MLCNSLRCLIITHLKRNIIISYVLINAVLGVPWRGTVQQKQTTQFDLVFETYRVSGSHPDLFTSAWSRIVSALAVVLLARLRASRV
jgi:hypothetical protein